MGLLDRIFGRRALTAAASIATTRQLETTAHVQARQVTEAWRVWRTLGEVHYVTTQQARLMSRVAWDIHLGGQELEAEQRDQLLTATFGNGVPELARNAALHLQVAGAYFMVRVNETWSVQPWPMPRAVQEQVTKTPDSIAVLVGTPDPVEAGRYDSPVLAALDVARELLLARAQSRAAARSRTAQMATLLYPNEGVADPKSFEQQMIDVMTAPLEDERSTASVVPNIVGFPGDKIGQWRLMELGSGVEDKLTDKIEGLIRQLAVMLDISPELLTGLGDANHWTGWLIQEDNWLGHVEPMAKVIGDGFAVALAQMAGVDPESVDIIPDPAPLLRRRPSIADALAAYDGGLVSDTWARAQLGADDDDKPIEDEQLEQAVQVALDMVRNAPSLAQNPGLTALVDQLRSVLGGSDVPPPKQTVEIVDGGSDSEPPTPAIAAARIPDMERLTERLLAIDEQAYDALDEVALHAVARISDKVGAQLRSTLQGDPELKAKASDVPNSELPALFPERVASLPNLQETVTDIATAYVTGSMQRVIDRAYDKTREAGVLIELDDETQANVHAAAVSSLVQLAMIALTGGATDALRWAFAQQVLTMAGGGEDPVVDSTAQTAAARKRIAMPSPLDGAGIALGRGAIGWVIDNLGKTPARWKWDHVGGATTDHPEHVKFHGRLYDGEYLIDSDGTQWFPGDHAGCRCRRVPQWEDV